MFLRETVEHCPTCAALTPHSRRSISGPAAVSSAALLGALACAWLGEAWWILAGVLVAGAAFLFFSDRERFWRVRCERCRLKKVGELRRTKPSLRGNTEIDIL